MALGPMAQDQMSPNELRSVAMREAHIDQELRKGTREGEITIGIDTDDLTELGAKALEERYRAAGWSVATVSLHHEQITLKA